MTDYDDLLGPELPAVFEGIPQGTPIWENAKKRGLVTDDMADWSRLEINPYRALDRAIFLSQTMPAAEMMQLYRRFRRLRFFRNLRGIINHPMRRHVPRIALELVAGRLRHTLTRVAPKAR